MKIAVMRTGGMGVLRRSSGSSWRRCIFFARGEHLNALKAEGLVLKGDGEENHLKPIVAMEQPSEIG